MGGGHGMSSRGWCSLQSLSSGVFIYVTFFEILQPELGSEEQHPSIIKLLFMLAGFICLALLAFIPENKSTELQYAVTTSSPVTTETANNILD
jgi:zinc transporter ZupT